MHLYIKPRIPGLETNLIVNTNKRIYRFRLLSFKTDYMSAVRFNYDFENKINVPNKVFAGSGNAYNESELDDITSNYSRLKDKTMDGSYVDVFWNYKVLYKSNSLTKPKWYPSQVFDDGFRTYLFIPDIERSSVRPIVMATNKKMKEFYVVNYRINGRYYIVDGVFPYLVLASGTEEIDRVFVERSAK